MLDTKESSAATCRKRKALYPPQKKDPIPIVKEAGMGLRAGGGV